MTTKKLDIATLLQKLSIVFTKDMYIIGSMYVINGPITEKESTGVNYCILTPECVDIIKERFGNINVIYFTDVKKAKASLGQIEEMLYIKTDFNKYNSKEILNKVDNIHNTISHVKSWSKFNWSDNEVAAMINGDMITLFTNDKNVPELYVSKVVFPGLGKNNVNNLEYSVYKSKKIDDVYELVTTLITDLFQIYTITRYINVN